MFRWRVTAAAAVLLLTSYSYASVGDRLPEFRDCLDTCSVANCYESPTPIPLHRRLLFWDCPAECDYACQHIITETRLYLDGPNNPTPVVQFHGKWPFHRFLGMQEPFSVFFSVLNLLAHVWGISQIREKIPSWYKLRRFYILFGYSGYAAWIASSVFHTRDFDATEKADYFMAGAYVMYQLYFSPIRIFRLDDPEGNKPWKASVMRLWTLICVLLYGAHVAYLTLWTWDYTYNMTANIVVGVLSNVLWTGFSYVGYQKSGNWWQAWPGLIVAWIVMAMSMELLEFTPWRLMIDAHSLWHLGTVGPTIWWYNFLVRDAQEDIQKHRFKS